MFVILLVSFLASVYQTCEGAEAPATNTFNPCARMNAVTPVKKKELLREIKSVFRGCGYSMLAKTSAVLSKNTSRLLPFARYKFCVLALTLYNYYSTRPNCIPKSVSKNATDFFNVLQRITVIIGRDFSVSREFCATGVCIEKGSAMRMVEDWLKCSRLAIHDTLIIECVEGFIIAVEIFTKLFEKSGIIRYYEG